MIKSQVYYFLRQSICDQRTHTNCLFTTKPDVVVILYHTLFIECLNVLIGFVRLFCVC